MRVVIDKLKYYCDALQCILRLCLLRYYTPSIEIMF